eukprot:scaffold3906_cov64-Attheya_sp.AAC.1
MMKVGSINAVKLVMLVGLSDLVDGGGVVVVKSRNGRLRERINGGATSDLIFFTQEQADFCIENKAKQVVSCRVARLEGQSLLHLVVLRWRKPGLKAERDRKRTQEFVRDKMHKRLKTLYEYNLADPDDRKIEQYGK